jgi:hypothetical protein
LWNVGVLGPVTLSGLNEGKRDLSHQKWTYQVLVPSRHPQRNAFIHITNAVKFITESH